MTLSLADAPLGIEEEEHDDEEVEEVAEEEAPGASVGANISDALTARFFKHLSNLKAVRKQRKKQLTIGTVVGPIALPACKDCDEQNPPPHAQGPTSGDNLPMDQMGVSYATDMYEGDAVLRTLRGLLAMVDDRGYSRSSQQLQFHNAFIRATSRVIFKKDWSRDRPKIMQRQGWTECPSEVLVSTPRRFGKTFS